MPEEKLNTQVDFNKVKLDLEATLLADYANTGALSLTTQEKLNLFSEFNGNEKLLRSFETDIINKHGLLKKKGSEAFSYRPIETSSTLESGTHSTSKTTTSETEEKYDINSTIDNLNVKSVGGVKPVENTISEIVNESEDSEEEQDAESIVTNIQSSIEDGSLELSEEDTDPTDPPFTEKELKRARYYVRQGWGPDTRTGENRDKNFNINAYNFALKEKKDKEEKERNIRDLKLESQLPTKDFDADSWKTSVMNVESEETEGVKDYSLEAPNSKAVGPYQLMYSVHKETLKSDFGVDSYDDFVGNEKAQEGLMSKLLTEKGPGSYFHLIKHSLQKDYYPQMKELNLKYQDWMALEHFVGHGELRDLLQKMKTDKNFGVEEFLNTSPGGGVKNHTIGKYLDKAFGEEKEEDDETGFINPLEDPNLMAGGDAQVEAEVSAELSEESLDEKEESDTYEVPLIGDLNPMTYYEDPIIKSSDPDDENRGTKEAPHFMMMGDALKRTFLGGMNIGDYYIIEYGYNNPNGELKYPVHGLYRFHEYKDGKRDWLEVGSWEYDLYITQGKEKPMTFTEWFDYIPPEFQERLDNIPSMLSKEEIESQKMEIIEELLEIKNREGYSQYVEELTGVKGTWLVNSEHHGDDIFIPVDYSKYPYPEQVIMEDYHSSRPTRELYQDFQDYPMLALYDLYQRHDGFAAGYDDKDWREKSNLEKRIDDWNESNSVYDSSKTFSGLLSDTSYAYRIPSDNTGGSWHGNQPNLGTSVFIPVTEQRIDVNGILEQINQSQNEEYTVPWAPSKDRGYDNWAERNRFGFGLDNKKLEVVYNPMSGRNEVVMVGYTGNGELDWDNKEVLAGFTSSEDFSQKPTKANIFKGLVFEIYLRGISIEDMDPELVTQMVDAKLNDFNVMQSDYYTTKVFQQLPKSAWDYSEEFFLSNYNHLIKDAKEALVRDMIENNIFIPDVLHGNQFEQYINDRLFRDREQKFVDFIYPKIKKAMSEEDQTEWQYVAFPPPMLGGTFMPVQLPDYDIFREAIETEFEKDKYDWMGKSRKDAVGSRLVRKMKTDTESYKQKEKQHIEEETNNYNENSKKLNKSFQDVRQENLDKSLTPEDEEYSYVPDDRIEFIPPDDLQVRLEEEINSLKEQGMSLLDIDSYIEKTYGLDWNTESGAFTPTAKYLQAAEDIFTEIGQRTINEWNAEHPEANRRYYFSEAWERTVGGMLFGYNNADYDVGYEWWEESILLPVMSIVIDPTTYISGGVGGQVAKWSVKGAQGRLISNLATMEKMVINSGKVNKIEDASHLVKANFSAQQAKLNLRQSMIGGAFSLGSYTTTAEIAMHSTENYQDMHVGEVLKNGLVNSALGATIGYNSHLLQSVKNRIAANYGGRSRVYQTIVNENDLATIKLTDLPKSSVFKKKPNLYGEFPSDVILNKNLVTPTSMGAFQTMNVWTRNRLAEGFFLGTESALFTAAHYDPQLSALENFQNNVVFLFALKGSMKMSPLNLMPKEGGRRRTKADFKIGEGELKYINEVFGEKQGMNFKNDKELYNYLDKEFKDALNVDKNGQLDANKIEYLRDVLSDLPLNTRYRYLDANNWEIGLSAQSVLPYGFHRREHEETDINGVTTKTDVVEFRNVNGEVIEVREVANIPELASGEMTFEQYTESASRETNRQMIEVMENDAKFMDNLKENFERNGITPEQTIKWYDGHYQKGGKNENLALDNKISQIIEGTHFQTVIEHRIALDNFNLVVQEQALNNLMDRGVKNPSAEAIANECKAVSNKLIQEHKNRNSENQRIIEQENNHQKELDNNKHIQSYEHKNENGDRVITSEKQNVSGEKPVTTNIKAEDKVNIGTLSGNEVSKENKNSIILELKNRNELTSELEKAINNCKNLKELQGIVTENTSIKALEYNTFKEKINTKNKNKNVLVTDKNVEVKPRIITKFDKLTIENYETLLSQAQTTSQRQLIEDGIRATQKLEAEGIKSEVVLHNNPESFNKILEKDGVTVESNKYGGVAYVDKEGNMHFNMKSSREGTDVYHEFTHIDLDVLRRKSPEKYNKYVEEVNRLLDTEIQLSNIKEIVDALDNNGKKIYAVEEKSDKGVVSTSLEKTQQFRGEEALIRIAEAIRKGEIDPKSLDVIKNSSSLDKIKGIINSTFEKLGIEKRLETSIDVITFIQNHIREFESTKIETTTKDSKPVQEVTTEEVKTEEVKTEEVKEVPVEQKEKQIDFDKYNWLVEQEKGGWQGEYSEAFIKRAKEDLAMFDRDVGRDKLGERGAEISKDFSYKDYGVTEIGEGKLKVSWKYGEDGIEQNWRMKESKEILSKLDTPNPEINKGQVSFSGTFDQGYQSLWGPKTKDLRGTEAYRKRTDREFVEYTLEDGTKVFGLIDKNHKDAAGRRGYFGIEISYDKNSNVTLNDVKKVLEQKMSIVNQAVSFEGKLPDYIHSLSKFISRREVVDKDMQAKTEEVKEVVPEGEKTLETLVNELETLKSEGASQELIDAKQLEVNSARIKYSQKMVDMEKSLEKPVVEEGSSQDVFNQSKELLNQTDLSEKTTVNEVTGIKETTGYNKETQNIIQKLKEVNFNPESKNNAELSSAYNEIVLKINEGTATPKEINDAFLKINSLEKGETIVNELTSKIEQHGGAIRGLSGLALTKTFPFVSGENVRLQGTMIGGEGKIGGVEIHSEKMLKRDLSTRNLSMIEGYFFMEKNGLISKNITGPIQEANTQYTMTVRESMTKWYKDTKLFIADSGKRKKIMTKMGLLLHQRERNSIDGKNVYLETINGSDGGGSFTRGYSKKELKLLEKIYNELPKDKDGNIDMVKAFENLSVTERKVLKTYEEMVESLKEKQKHVNEINGKEFIDIENYFPHLNKTRYVDGKEKTGNISNEEFLNDLYSGKKESEIISDRGKYRTAEGVLPIEYNLDKVMNNLFMEVNRAYSYSGTLKEINTLMDNMKIVDKDLTGKQKQIQDGTNLAINAIQQRIKDGVDYQLHYNNGFITHAMRNLYNINYAHNLISVRRLFFVEPLSETLRLGLTRPLKEYPAFFQQYIDGGNRRVQNLTSMGGRIHGVPENTALDIMKRTGSGGLLKQNRIGMEYESPGQLNTMEKANNYLLGMVDRSQMNLIWMPAFKSTFKQANNGVSFNAKEYNANPEVYFQKHARIFRDASRVADRELGKWKNEFAKGGKRTKIDILGLGTLDAKSNWAPIMTYMSNFGAQEVSMLIKGMKDAYRGDNQPREQALREVLGIASSGTVYGLASGVAYGFQQYFTNRSILESQLGDENYDEKIIRQQIDDLDNLWEQKFKDMTSLESIKKEMITNGMFLTTSKYSQSVKMVLGGSLSISNKLLDFEEWKNAGGNYQVFAEWKEYADELYQDATYSRLPNDPNDIVEMMLPQIESAYEVFWKEAPEAWKTYINRGEYDADIEEEFKEEMSMLNFLNTSTKTLLFSFGKALPFQKDIDQTMKMYYNFYGLDIDENRKKIKEFRESTEGSIVPEYQGGPGEYQGGPPEYQGGPGDIQTQTIGEEDLGLTSQERKERKEKENREYEEYMSKYKGYRWWDKTDEELKNDWEQHELKELLPLEHYLRLFPGHKYLYE
jgi:hypothetical protein